MGGAEHWGGCKGRAPAAQVTDDLQPLSVSLWTDGASIPAPGLSSLLQH